MTKQTILDLFNLTESDLLGEGGEAWVYSLDNDRVLRIHMGATGRLPYLERQRKFYDSIQGRFDFKTPRILQIDCCGELLYSIEERIEGSDLSSHLPNLSKAEKEAAFLKYIDAVQAIGAIKFPDLDYGQVLADDPKTSTDWPKFLLSIVADRVSASKAALDADIGSLEKVERKLIDLCLQFPHQPDKCLVHGDYWPCNVMVDATCRVTGVIDFSTMVTIGDPMMDIAGSYLWLETLGDYSPPDSVLLLAMLRERFGDKVIDVIAFYRGYFSLYYFSTCGWQPLRRWYGDNLRKLIQ